MPKIHNTLNSGGGLLKSGDRGETRGLFGRGSGETGAMFGRRIRRRR
jgi:hypothetical protein